LASLQAIKLIKKQHTKQFFIILYDFDTQM